MMLILALSAGCFAGCGSSEPDKTKVEATAEIESQQTEEVSAEAESQETEEASSEAESQELEEAAEPESAEIPTGLIEPGVVRIKAMNSDEYLLFTFNPECGVTYDENLDLFSADTDGDSMMKFMMAADQIDRPFGSGSVGSMNVYFMTDSSIEEFQQAYRDEKQQFNIAVEFMEIAPITVVGHEGYNFSVVPGDIAASFIVFEMDGDLLVHEVALGAYGAKDTQDEILAENLDKAITWMELTYVDAVVEQ